MPLTSPGVATLSYYDNSFPGNTVVSEGVNNSLYICPLDPINEITPGVMSVNTIFINVTGTVSTAASFTRSMSIGFYTSVAGNSTQLSRVFSASTSWGTNAANANVNNSMGGWRWVTFHSSQFDVAPVLNQVRYWVALWNRSSSGSQSFSLMGMQSLGMSNVRSGFMSVGSATDTTLGWGRFRGAYSATFSTAMPNTLGAVDINKNVAGAIFVPQIIFNNVGTNIL